MTDITVRIIDGWPLDASAAEPLIRDTDLAERLGYERPRKIRELIERMYDESSGICRRPTVGRRGFAEKIVEEFWLTEAQALKVAARSETDPADALLDDMIRVFMLARRGALLAQAPALTRRTAVAFLVNEAMAEGKDGAAVAFLNAARALAKPGPGEQLTLVDVGEATPKPVGLAPYRKRVLDVATQFVGTRQALVTLAGGKVVRTRAAVDELVAEGVLVREERDGRVVYRHADPPPPADVH